MDKLAVLEEFDNFAPLRNALRDIAADRDHWAGIPMPLDNETLVIEPTYPKAAELMGITTQQRVDELADAGVTIRNTFWSTHRRCHILIMHMPDGKIDWGLQYGIHHLGQDLRTLGCAEAWGLEQESNALNTLGGLVRHRQFKQYLLTGMFLETSKRSGLTYLFRKLRPTVVIRGDRIVCTLCMHPIGYYEGSWAGVMTPSDDVISHLMLMRGDEAMLWRRANQHPSYSPSAGL